MVGIYQIRNLVNGFVYIGSSKNVKNRLNGHRYSLRHNKSVVKTMQEDWNKFGEENFVFEIVEEVGVDELLEKEAAIINKSKNIYNKLKPKLRQFGFNLKKKCSVCGLVKDYSEFHKDGHQKYGVRSQCKQCRSRKKIRKQIVKENHKLLDKSISRSIYRALKNNKSGYIWERIINISYDELRKHLENQFDDIMNWDNYGSYWVVDKIIPTSMYRYSDRINNEFLKAWNIKNFRPYPRVLHNRKKKDIIWEVIDHYKLYDILPAGLLGDTLWIKKNL